MSTVEKVKDSWEPQSYPIPKHWKYVGIDSFFSNISLSGKKLPQKEYLETGSFPVVDQGANLIGGFSNDEDKVISTEIPVVVFGDHTKCLKYITFSFIPGADGIKVLQPKGLVNPKYAFFACQSLKLPDRGYSRHFSFLKKSQFPLAPLEEQKSIVAKIEELFSELDSGIASLKTAQEQLKIYRQALLKHAFEGKLTEQWRKDNADKLEAPEQLLARIQTERETRYQQQLDEWKQAVKDWEAKGKEGKRPSKPAKPSTFNTVDLTINELSELPDNWRWMYFGDLVTVASNLVSPIDYPDLPHIAPDNIERNTGKLLPYKTISEDGVTSPKHYFYAGQIIYSKIRPNLSKLTLIDFDGLCSADMYPLQSDCYIHSFLKYLMLTKDFVTQSSTAGSRSVLPKINQTELSKLKMPFCSLTEQQEIVNQLEEKLSIIEQNEKEIEDALTKAELLRQSILKKAFSGRLIYKE